MTPAQSQMIYEWIQQITADPPALTDAGLLMLRARLDPTSNEFSPSTALDNLRQVLADEFARRLGCTTEELPGYEPPSWDWDSILQAWALADPGE